MAEWGAAQPGQGHVQVLRLESGRNRHRLLHRGKKILPFSLKNGGKIQSKS